MGKQGAGSNELKREGGGEIEAGQAEIRKEKPLPSGWEYIWPQDHWTHPPEHLMVPREEAERQREVKPVKSSYWREKEAQEWGCKIQEERATLVKERRDRAHCMRPKQDGKTPPSVAHRNGPLEPGT